MPPEFKSNSGLNHDSYSIFDFNLIEKNEIFPNIVKRTSTKVRNKTQVAYDLQFRRGKATTYK